MARNSAVPITATEPPRAPCKWEGCLQRAVINDEIEPGKGRHNLCEYHYIEAHKLRAKRWCEAKGLFTVEQKRDYCRSLFPRLVERMRSRERQPGED